MATAEVASRGQLLKSTSSLEQLMESMKSSCGAWMSARSSCAIVGRAAASSSTAIVFERGNSAARGAIARGASTTQVGAMYLAFVEDWFAAVPPVVRPEMLRHFHCDFFFPLFGLDRL